MSKSKGNFFTVRDVLEGKVTGRAVDPAVLRYELLKAHYRTNMNFTRKGLEESAQNVMKLREARRKAGAGRVGTDHPVVRDFIEALSDDLNMSKALSVVFDWLKKRYTQSGEAAGVLDRINSVLHVMPGSDSVVAKGLHADPDACRDHVAVVGSADQGVLAKCKEIDVARKAKDYDTADRVRQELVDAGYDVKTTKGGTVAEKKLA